MGRRKLKMVDLYVKKISIVYLFFENFSYFVWKTDMFHKKFSIYFSKIFSALHCLWNRDVTHCRHCVLRINITRLYSYRSIYTQRIQWVCVVVLRCRCSRQYMRTRALFAWMFVLKQAATTWNGDAYIDTHSL